MLSVELSNIQLNKVSDSWKDTISDKASMYQNKVIKLIHENLKIQIKY